MHDPVEIRLLPLGEVLRVKRGSPMRDLLFIHGVEFPCGGQALCKGCKIKVLKGSLRPSAEDEAMLSPAELADGWRLACCAQANSDLTIELAQWETTILTDESAFAFTQQPGWGIAIDVGTTTLVAQLLDLETGYVLGVKTALNAQARHGADIMSRVEHALAGNGQAELTSLIRDQIALLIRDLLVEASHAGPLPEEKEDQRRRRVMTPAQGCDLKRVVLVGNTVMHHLFSGLSLEPLSHYPFEPVSPGLQTFRAADLGWQVPDNPIVQFLPCLGGFVGSDILAGILATRMHESDAVRALIDLGTNGEIVVGNRDRILCASTAAGPAFEGARISMGMRAATGAISEVHIEHGALRYHVLGNGKPRGICGSGLVDAVAAGLNLGTIHPSGRLNGADVFKLAPPVVLTSWDVRELQLAKGAIAAGSHLLLQQWGATNTDLAHVYLAGAFGNYINRASARRIGLLNFPPEKVVPSGNTALLGAKLALFSPPDIDLSYAGLRQKIRHLPLNEDGRFQETYVAEMAFP